MISITKKISGYSQKFAKKINLEKNAKLIVPVAVIGAWGFQTSLEYKYAVKEDKKNAFISNLIIGSAMFLGGFAGHGGYMKYLKHKTVDKLAGNLAKNHFLKMKDIVEAFSIPVGAGLLGGIAGEITQRIFPVKYKTPDKILKKANEVIDFNAGLMDRIDDFPGADLVDLIHPSFSTIVGYSVAKEKGVKNKIKKFVFEIVSGVVVPLIAIIPVLRYLKNKIPNKKSVITLVTVTTGVAASFIGKSVAKWINKKVTDRILEDEIWENIMVKQRELVKSSIFSNNPFKQKQIEDKLTKLDSLKTTIKDFGVRSEHVGLASTNLQPQV